MNQVTINPIIPAEDKEGNIILSIAGHNTQHYIKMDKESALDLGQRLIKIGTKHDESERKKTA